MACSACKRSRVRGAGQGADRGAGAPSARGRGGLGRGTARRRERIGGHRRRTPGDAGEGRALAAPHCGPLRRACLRGPAPRARRRSAGRRGGRAVPRPGGLRADRRGHRPAPVALPRPRPGRRAGGRSSHHRRAPRHRRRAGALRAGDVQGRAAPREGAGRRSRIRSRSGPRSRFRSAVAGLRIGRSEPGARDRRGRPPHDRVHRLPGALRRRHDRLRPPRDLRLGGSEHRRRRGHLPGAGREDRVRPGEDRDRGPHPPRPGRRAAGVAARAAPQDDRPQPEPLSRHGRPAAKRPT